MKVLVTLEECPGCSMLRPLEVVTDSGSSGLDRSAKGVSLSPKNRVPVVPHNPEVTSAEVQFAGVHSANRMPLGHPTLTSSPVECGGEREMCPSAVNMGEIGKPAGVSLQTLWKP